MARLRYIATPSAWSSHSHLATNQPSASTQSAVQSNSAHLATPPSSMHPQATTTAEALKDVPIKVRKQIARKQVGSSTGRQAPPTVAFNARKSTTAEARNFSGDTLVDYAKQGAAAAATAAPTNGTLQTQTENLLEGEVEKALNLPWEPEQLADNLLATINPLLDTRETTPDIVEPRMNRALDSISEAAGKIKSALGKRSRDAVESGREALGLAKKRQSGRIRALESETPVAESSYASDDSQSVEPPAKRPKPSSYENDANFCQYGTRRKRYENSGLYVGMRYDDRKALPRKYLPLPMWGYLENVVHFRVPFDVYAPQSTRDVAPADWRKLNTNRFIDEARHTWRRSTKLAKSECGCKPSSITGREGCGDNCLNRTMAYECDANNCSLSADQCTNRAFHQLAARMKKGGRYDHGIEIIKTRDKGHGVCASRSFAPGQIIVEYCGEVITPEECDRRMNEEYKDKDCYYLMDFDQGMIIDATRGNIARFVNHACEPNCRMEKRIVRNEPKMALFAGPNGIMTGEELTYDYNFDNFSTLNVLDCRCGSERCRGKLDRRDAKKEKDSLAASLKRKAAELLSKNEKESSAEPQVLKKRKTARWSKGWSYVDPKMELMRLQEDAIENGKPLTAKEIEELAKKNERRSAELTIESEFSAISKTSAVSVRSEKLRQRPSRVSPEVSRRKSVLGRAAGRLVRQRLVPKTTLLTEDADESGKESSRGAYYLPELDFGSGGVHTCTVTANAVRTDDDAASNEQILSGKEHSAARGAGGRKRPFSAMAADTVASVAGVQRSLSDKSGRVLDSVIGRNRAGRARLG